VIRVYLVEDETIVREGLKALLALAKNIQVAGESADGLHAVAAIAQCRPDVVLLDIRMPKLDGLGVLRELATRGFLPPAVVLTTFPDPEVVTAAIRGGAKGYLLKDVSLDVLIEAIETVFNGGTWLQPATTSRMLEALKVGPRPDPAIPPADPLTEREVEVLRLMAGAYNNREIAAALGCAEATVKNHVASILSKMSARDRMLAVLRAVDAGYF
jgi:DNA-binding NarL/FixJ family response regulator